MTPAERQDPKIINSSRRQRIAKGSGSTVAAVNALVDRFFEARKMMQSMAGKFGLPGARSNRKAVKGRKGKKTTGRGPTQPKMKGLPPGFPGMAGLGGMPGGLPGAAPGAAAPGQLPPGFDFDPSTLKFPPK